MRVFPGISSLSLGVRSVERATVFYEMLGWRRTGQASTRAVSVFELNNLVLMLHPADALAQDVGAQPPAQETGFCVFTQNYGTAEGVGFAMAQARKAGGRILRAAAADSFGRRDKTSDAAGASGVFADPDGHIWTILHDPRLIPAVDGSIKPER